MYTGYGAIGFNDTLTADNYALTQDKAVGGATYLNAKDGSSIYFNIGNFTYGSINYPDGNWVIGGVSGFTTNNPILYHCGQIASASDYIAWQLDDTDDYFHLSPKPVGSGGQLLGFKIDMPVDLVDNDLTTTGTTTTTNILGAGGTVPPLMAITVDGEGSQYQLVNKEYVDLAVSSLSLTEFFHNDASDIGIESGVQYYLMDTTEDASATVTSAGVPTGAAVNIFNFATASGSPALDRLVAGIYHVHMHAYRSASVTRTVTLYYELYKRVLAGTETLLGASEVVTLSTTSEELEPHLALATEVPLLTTDRLVIKMWATVTGAGGADPAVSIDVGSAENSHFAVNINALDLQNIFVPYAGAKSDVDLGSKNLTTTGFLGVGGINDNAGTPALSIDPNNRILYTTDGSPSLSWEERIAYNASGNEMFNWVNENNVVFNDKLLSGVDSVLGVAENIGVNLYNGTLADSAPNISLDWENRILYASDGSTESLNWGNGLFKDASGYESIDYYQRIFRNIDETAVITWDGGVTLKDSSGVSALGTDERSFYDTSEVLSLDWGNRIFYASDGTTPVLDYSVPYTSGLLGGLKFALSSNEVNGVAGIENTNADGYASFLAVNDQGNYMGFGYGGSNTAVPFPYISGDGIEDFHFFNFANINMGEYSITTADGNAGQVLTTDGAGTVSWEDGGGGVKTHSFGMIIDGGSSLIATGIKGYVTIPYTGTIKSWTLLECSATPVSSSIVIDVWKDTYANYPPTVADTMIGGGGTKPTLTSAIKNTDSTLTDWNTAVTAGDIIGFNVDSVSGAYRVSITFEIEQ
jgi:hypothetical protein